MALGSVEVAKLYAKIGVDVSDFTKGLSKAKDDLGVFQRGMSGLQSAIGTGLKVAAGVAVTAAGGLAAGISVATKAAADMEQQLANISAVMGTSAEETAVLKDLITDLGLDPRLQVNATEAAAAIEMLGKNGLTVDQILQGAARSTVLLANSTGADFATAADIATDVMAQFNIAAGDMDKAVNGIAGVTVASKFSIDDYRLAIAQAGGVASSVGVEFDDFNAVIAATSPSFASGSDAGTSFKTFLQRLVPQSNTARDAMSALGLITEDGANAFFDAGGQMKSMSEIAGILQGAFGNLSEEQAIQAASTIFGTDAMRTAFALAKGGTETIDEMKRVIGNTSAEDSAAKRMDTLRGSWEIFQGVAETLTLSIGEKFLPVAKRVIEWATEMASQYGPMVIEWAGRMAETVDSLISYLGLFLQDGDALNDWLTHLPEPIQDVILGFQGFYDAIASAIRWIGDILGRFVSWQDVWTAAAVLVGVTVVSAIGSFIAAIAPVVAVVGGVVIAVAALRTAWENDWGGIKTATNTAKEYLAERFGNLGKAIQEFGGESLGEIKAWAMGQDTEFTATKKIWEAARESFGKVFDDIGDKLVEWGKLAMTEFRERFPKAAEALTDAWDNIKQRWNDFWAVLKPAIEKLVKAVKDMVGDWKNGTGSMGDAIETAKGVIDGVLTILVSIVETAISNVIDAMKLVVQLLSGDWEGAWQTAKDIFVRTWEMIKGAAVTALDTILDAFGVSIEDIRRIVDKLLEHGRAFVSNFRQGVMERWNEFKTWFDERVKALPQPIQNLISSTLQWGRDIVQGLWDGVRGMWTTFTGWFRDRWDDLTRNFKSFFGIHSPSALFRSFGMSLGEGLQNGIQASSAAVFGAMDSMSSGILSRANALEVSLDGSIAQIASRISALQNQQAQIAQVAQTAAQQVAAYNMPTVATATPRTPTVDVPSLLHQSIGQLVGNNAHVLDLTLSRVPSMIASLAEWSDDFAQSVSDFIRPLQRFSSAEEYDAAVAAGWVGPEFGLALQTALNPTNASNDALIQAINTLTVALRNAPQEGQATQFNLHYAPQQSTGNLFEDLAAQVHYLSALYGAT